MITDSVLSSISVLDDFEHILNSFDGFFRSLYELFQSFLSVNRRKPVLFRIRHFLIIHLGGLRTSHINFIYIQ